MKKIKSIHICGLLFVLSASAQAATTHCYNKVSIGNNPTVINASITLKPTAELYLGSDRAPGLLTNRLDITGDYTGEAGAKVFLSLLGNPTQAKSGFVEISGTANGSTEIIPDLFDGWKGERFDVIRAKAENSNADAFFISKAFADCGAYNVFLTHREENGSFVWSVYGTPAAPLIVPLLNHTILVNNNDATNGGYKFVYYSWYKDGELLKEGSHYDLGGSYYTGGTSLDAAEYHTEMLDTESRWHYTCPYLYQSQDIAQKVTAYPNPVSRGMQVYVKVEDDDEALYKNATVEIYNYMGQYFGKVQTDGRRITPVNLPQTAGIYILKFKANGVETAFKIIVN
ncbi:hypothetical protein AGMMS4957_15900 [Bacteroidia bacterium]|nr:hypothetical protein AGMMS4957_15900 [Bacteroidia bacterium]